MLNVSISLITEPSSKLPEYRVWDIFFLAVCVPVNILGFVPVGDQGNTSVVHKYCVKQSIHILQLVLDPVLNQSFLLETPTVLSVSRMHTLWDSL